MSIAQNYPALKPSLLLDFANTKKLDSRVTFARASEGRYYDGQTVAKAEENLLRYSQQFDVTVSGWAKSRGSVTADTTTAPDGTTTADTFTEDSANGFHYVVQTLAALPDKEYTVSAFVKDNTRGYATVGIQQNTAGSGFIGASFIHVNLSTGAYVLTESSGTPLASISYSISNTGSGWYRVSVTGKTGATAGQVQVFVTPSNGTSNTYAGDGTSSFYIWGAQLEQRSSVTAYTPTTTQPITNYIPVLQTADANVARFDHDPVTGESLGLLVEEQRTNLVTYSEDFGNAVWTKSNATITDDTIVAPDGTLTGDKLVEDATIANHTFSQGSLSVTSGVSYTLSIYAKAAERTQLFIALGSEGFGLTTSVIINLTDGSTVTSANSPTISATLIGNGWYRITLTKTAGSTVSNQSVYIRSAVAGTTNYTGDGYSGIYIWGAQIEAGAFPTSYIPTTTSQVTRSADSAVMTGENFSSWYRADEGTMYAEFDWIVPTSTSPINARGPWSINNSANVAIAHNVYNGSGQAVFRTTDDTGSGQTFMNYASGSPLSGLNKFVGAYKTNDYAFVATGQSVLTDTTALVPNSVNQLWIGQTSSAYKHGYIRKLAYYPLRLSNTNLQALTS